MEDHIRTTLHPRHAESRRGLALEEEIRFLLATLEGLDINDQTLQEREAILTKSVKDLHRSWENVKASQWASHWKRLRDAPPPAADAVNAG